MSMTIGSFSSFRFQPCKLKNFDLLGLSLRLCAKKNEILEFLNNIISQKWRESEEK